MKVYLNFQLLLLESDTVFQNISSAGFNELDIDSYFEYIKTTIFYWNFIANSLSAICVFVNVYHILKFGSIKLQIQSIKKNLWDDLELWRLAIYFE